ncbi:hypothetical protein [Streptomyces cacaoi]|uniref:Uncharacterized protein n=2 Tax=Streptomyces TaxID=1883 RepID=A0A4Y3R1P1_STRCI|nr:hypothetical protein [Streptomyces cacaoi]GEB51189.1 hypothetical protein SCA03_37400 [Streptomyces cacaoi]
MCLHSQCRAPVRHSQLSAPHGIGPTTMTLPTTAHDTLLTLASGGEHGEGGHESLSPFLTGGGALVALFLLLWITTRFNRDR